MKIFYFVGGIIYELLVNIGYFIKNNLNRFANIINFMLPFVMLFIGEYVYKFRGYYGVGGEIAVPAIVALLVYILRSAANKMGKGITIPVPKKRFTEVDDDGEVSVRNDRVQELILYLADLEDWLERKGLL